MSQSLRKSPLYNEHQRLGAKLVDFGGWEMPLAYPLGTVAEHTACRNDAVAFDVSHLGTVRVEGPEAFGALQQALTNDLRKISPGQTQYTHLLDDNGWVLDDIIVWWVSEQQFDVMPNASNTSSVVQAIGGQDVTSQRAVIAVQGPTARAHVAKISPEAAKVERNHTISVDWKGTTLTVGGTGYTGEDGLEIAVVSDRAADLWRELVETGVTPAGLGARDTLRLEAGLPLHGHELGNGITPLQAGLGWVIGWDKESFTGRQALAAEKEAGISRRLRGLMSDTRQPLRAESPIRVDGEVVGVTTSGNVSPVLGRGIALGFLPPHFGPGTRVEIELRGRLVEAEITKLPFVKH